MTIDFSDVPWWIVLLGLELPAVLVGFLLLIGYYHVVIRRNSPFTRGR